MDSYHAIPAHDRETSLNSYAGDSDLFSAPFFLCPPPQEKGDTILGDDFGPILGPASCLLEFLRLSVAGILPPVARQGLTKVMWQMYLYLETQPAFNRTAFCSCPWLGPISALTGGLPNDQCKRRSPLQKKN